MFWKEKREIIIGLGYNNQFMPHDGKFGYQIPIFNN
jgi:hypothetical protein